MKAVCWINVKMKMRYWQVNQIYVGSSDCLCEKRNLVKPDKNKLHFKIILP